VKGPSGLSSKEGGKILARLSHSNSLRRSKLIAKQGEETQRAGQLEAGN